MGVMILKRYQKSLRNAVGSSAAPYGYTLVAWSTAAVLTNARYTGFDTQATLLTWHYSLRGHRYPGGTSGPESNSRVPPVRNASMAP